MVAIFTFRIIVLYILVISHSVTFLYRDVVGVLA
jgi:hypothetical protein